MTKRTEIVWHNEIRKLNDLKPFEFNPRDITKNGLKDLNKSISKFGLAEPIVINTTNTIIGGHARYFVLKEQGKTECSCYVPNRKLTDSEVKELNIRLNKNIAGEWDWDILANSFEMDDLLEWGFQDWEFTGSNEEESDEPTDRKTITCPECGHEF